MRCTLTIGNFDGVHLGHQALLRASAETNPGQNVHALFFDPHPADFFGRRIGPLLTSATRRQELLVRAGASQVDIRPFDAAFASLEPEPFVRTIIADEHAASMVIVGSDFRFGKRAKGNTDTLRELGEQYDYKVMVVDSVVDSGSPVSSTRIRAALQEGDVATATRLLGRAHDLDGIVIEGDQRGRTIGFPTANLGSTAGLMPADGVYAVVVRLGERVLHGMANIGTRPTFGAGRSTEAHLFDFDEDIYGASVRVAFVARLRDEVRFDGVDALKAQLRADRIAAQRRLSESDEGTWRWI